MHFNSIEVMRWLNFFLLAGLVWKFGIPPMLRLLDSESDATQSSSQQAALKKDEAQKQVEEARKKLEGFEKEAEAMKILALHHAKVLVHTVKSETEEEIGRLHQFADYETKSIEAETKQKVHIETVKHAVAVSQKMLASKMTLQDQTHLTQQFIELIKNSQGFLNGKP